MQSSEGSSATYTLLDSRMSEVWTLSLIENLMFFKVSYFSESQKSTGWAANCFNTESWSETYRVNWEILSQLTDVDSNDDLEAVIVFFRQSGLEEWKTLNSIVASLENLVEKSESHYRNLVPFGWENQVPRGFKQLVHETTVTLRIAERLELTNVEGYRFGNHKPQVSYLVLPPERLENLWGLLELGSATLGDWGQAKWSWNWWRVNEFFRSQVLENFETAGRNSGFNTYDFIPGTYYSPIEPVISEVNQLEDFVDHEGIIYNKGKLIVALVPGKDLFRLVTYTENGEYREDYVVRWADVIGRIPRIHGKSFDLKQVIRAYPGDVLTRLLEECRNHSYIAAEIQHMFGDTTFIRSIAPWRSYLTFMSLGTTRKYDLWTPAFVDYCEGNFVPIFASLRGAQRANHEDWLEFHELVQELCDQVEEDLPVQNL